MQFYLLSLLIGILLSSMSVINTEVSLITTNEISILLNQSIALIILTLILSTNRNNKVINPPKKKAKLRYWFGGCFGLFIISSINYAIPLIGVILSVSCVIFGQGAMALILDCIGFMGIEKKKISLTKLLGLAISLSGILVMIFFSKGKFEALPIIISIIAGAASMFQMAYNSYFASLKGPFFSATANMVTGLLSVVIFMLLFRPISDFSLITTKMPLLFFFGSGAIGVITVTCSNIVVAKIPAVYSAILISSGQIIASMVLDKVLYNIFTPVLLIGSILMLLGIATNILIDKQN